MSKIVALKLGGSYEFNDPFNNISAVRFIGGGNKYGLYFPYCGGAVVVMIVW
jgi:hypothetical protein